MIDPAQLNALYQLIGWDCRNRRTEAETTEMLRVSRYCIAAYTAEGALVGFARVCGDPYVAQVLARLIHFGRPLNGTVSYTTSTIMGGLRCLPCPRNSRSS